MKKNGIYTVLLALALVGQTSAPAFAVERDPAAKKSQKVSKKTSKKAKPATARKDRAKTVGDLLKGLQELKKNAAAIPQSQMARPKITRPKALTSVAPSRSNQFYDQSDEDEAMLESALDKEINELFKLTNRYKTSPNRGELWLRLAELYVEKSRMHLFRSQSDFDRRSSEWEAGDRKGPAPKMNLEVGQDFNKKAVQLYEWFLADFPKDPKIDQALFFLGYNYTELGQVAKGMGYYERLTKEFPKSPYISESHFALGEFHFENREWKKSEQAYRRVLDSRSARLYGFALYKVAWTFYRQGRVDAAIKTMEQVVAHSRKQVEVSKSQGLKSVNRIRLASEALKDIVPFYAEARDFKAAKGYFLELGGEKALFTLLERLAYVYTDSGKQDAARYVFKQLLDLNPTAPKAYDYQYQIVINYQSKGSRDVFREELFQWVRSYGPESDWARANAGNDELLRRAMEQREGTLRNYVLLQHQTAQNTRNAGPRKLAREGYELYLKTFPKTDKTAEMSFFYGELLFDLNQMELAAAQYNWVAENTGKENKYFEQATLNAVLAFERTLPAEAEIRKRAGESLEPLEYGANERRFIDAANRYLATFPKGEKVPDIRFKLARMAYTYNRFDEALPMFQDIVKRYPKTQYATFSANLILDIYNLRKDFEGLSRAGTDMIQSGDLKNPEVNAEIRDAVERAQFKKAQDAETSGNYLNSAKEYETFAGKYPGSKLANSARFNAAINFERAGLILPAIVGYKAIADNRDKKNPVSDDVRKKSSRLLARLYEQTGQFELAAVELERYAKEFPKDNVADAALFNAAVIWDGLGANVRAINNYENYYKTSKAREKREALFEIAQIQESRNALSAAVTFYQQYLDSNPAAASKVILANFRIAVLSKKLNRITKAKEGFQKTIAVQKRLSGGKGLGASEAAESRFELANETLRELETLRIPANPQRQGDAIKRKLDLVTRLNNEMAEVIKYDDGQFVIAALTTAGRAYDHMSRSLYDAPKPAGLNADEMKAYNSEVDKIAAPMRQNAVDNYRRAVTKSHEIQVYNKWVIDAMAAMNRIDKNQFSETGERVLNSREFEAGI